MWRTIIGRGPGGLGKRADVEKVERFQAVSGIPLNSWTALSIAHNIFHRRACLNIVDGIEYESTVPGEDSAAPLLQTEEIAQSGHATHADARNRRTTKIYGYAVRLAVR